MSQILKVAQIKKGMYVRLFCGSFHQVFIIITQSDSICVLTLEGLVVDTICLASLLSPTSSPILSSDETFVFFLSLLDLHWISVNKPEDAKTKQVAFDYAS